MGCMIDRNAGRNETRPGGLLALLLVLLVLLGVSACNRQAEGTRHCVPMEQIESWLEAEACDTLARELATCRERNPESVDFRSLHRLQDAATYCYVRNAACDRAAEITPRGDKTRFHLSWVAGCYQATGRFAEASALAAVSLDYWSESFSHPRALPPLVTCLQGDEEDPPGSEEQALQLALCTYLNSSIQAGLADEIPPRMQGAVRDPNWPLLLYDYYLNHGELERARLMLTLYLAQGGCPGNQKQASLHTRRTRQRACLPAMRYMASIGLCRESEEIYEQVRPSRADAKEAPLLLMLGNCFLAEGDSRSAAAYAAQVRERLGDTYDLYLLNGHIALHENRSADALFYFELATDIARRSARAKPAEPMPRLELSGALRMQAQALTMAGRAQEAGPLVDEAWEIAQSALAAEPDNPYWKFAAANAAHFRNDLETQARLLLDAEGLSPAFGAGDLIEAAALTGRHSVVMTWAEAALVANHQRPSVRLVLLVYVAMSHGLCGDRSEAARLAEEVRRLAAELPHGCPGWYARAALTWAEANPGPYPATLLHLLRSLDHCSGGGPAVDVADALDAFLSACAGEPEGIPMDCR